MNEPLSPAAQAVLTAQAKRRCLFEWSNVNDPPCHPSDPDWNGCVQCIDRLGVAAAVRELAEQVVPEEEACWRTEPEAVSDSVFAAWKQRQQTRSEFLAIATELETTNA
jgi:hypothetical protein